jgi:hypothetical protein
MPRQRQDNYSGEDQGNREAADEQDQAEPERLARALKRRQNGLPLFRRIGRHADQHCHHRRSEQPSSWIVTGGCYVHRDGSLLPQVGGAFLIMRRLPCGNGEAAVLFLPVLSDGSDSLAREPTGVQRCCAQACGQPVLLGGFPTRDGAPPPGLSALWLPCYVLAVMASFVWLLSYAVFGI